MGNILGLFFGTFLYIYGGYTLPFLVYGIAHLAISPMIFVMIPGEMDEYKAKLELKEKVKKAAALGVELEDLEKQEEKETASSTDGKIRVSDLSDDVYVEDLQETSSIPRLLANKKILKYLMFAMFDICMLNFHPAILSKRLSQLGIDTQFNPFFFALPFVFPVFSAAIYLKFQNKIRG